MPKTHLLWRVSNLIPQGQRRKVHNHGLGVHSPLTAAIDGTFAGCGENGPTATLGRFNGEDSRPRGR
jgi:hypothetical protein